jgi:predicted transcriptional regulator
VKNVTLSADDDLIEKARTIARARRSTLNAEFREWLAQFTAIEGGAQNFDALMGELRLVNSGRRFTRDEMNER